jgi:hypothetical protein
MKKLISDKDSVQSRKFFAEGPAEATVYLEPANPPDNSEE